MWGQYIPQNDGIVYFNDSVLMVSLQSGFEATHSPTVASTHEGECEKETHMNIYASKRAEHEWVWKYCTLLPQRDHLKPRTCLQSLLLSIITTVVGSCTSFEPRVYTNYPLNAHLTSLGWQVLVFTEGSGWAALVKVDSTHHHPPAQTTAEIRL